MTSQCFTTEGVQGTPAITLLPDVKELPRFLKTPKFKSDIGSTQLRETFPKIPNNLLTEDFQACARTGHHSTALFLAELKMLSTSTDKERPMAAKLLFAFFGEDLTAFIKDKLKCRTAVLGKTEFKAGTKEAYRVLLFLQEPLS